MYTIKPILYIYLIHTESCTIRGIRIHGIIQQLRLVAMRVGYDVIIRLVLKPNADTLESNMSEMQNKVNYSSVNDDFFDSQRAILSMPMISNIEKQKKAWEHAKKISKYNKNSNDLHLIIEDDLFIVPGIGLTNFKEFLEKHINEQISSDWDLLFLSVSKSNENDELTINDYHSTGLSILPSKEAYFINPEIIPTLLSEFEVYRFHFRTQLSYVMKKNKLIRPKFLSKRCFLDGSKLGLIPSTIHSNNILIYNREYMELFMIKNSDKNITSEISNINKLFKSLESLNSPDVFYIYGSLLLKAGNINDAEKYLRLAINEIKRQQGILNNNSDIMNILIELYKNKQNDIKEIQKKPSIYSDPSIALSD